MGMDITMEEVEIEAGMKDDGPGGGAVDKSVGRPHIASVLIRKGYAKDKQEVFDKFLAKGAPAYFSRFTASPEESIKQIHAAGGVAILAHPPYLLKEENDAEMDAIVGGLKAAGLDGIEVHYSTHTPKQTEFISGLAKKYSLLPSGGSDFHGEPAVKAGDVAIDLGVGKGNLRIPDEILENFKKLKASRAQ
jgi:predicted metal-dependent phosphoesterase TrpH